ncbi:MAG: hypothetical protein C5S48_07235 [Candidatus Methanogaster sp.]|nr:MAG: hypothetical protein C5S48_07235 [ANME-2 cluster archaeon]
MFSFEGLENIENWSRSKGHQIIDAHLRMIGGSVHCKDKGPAECGLDMLEFLEWHPSKEHEPLSTVMAILFCQM